jgi:pimeloyl-ACP methyl ester carboxylesterase/predicted glycosyltransferase
MRARYPDTEGFAVRNGAKIFYEIYDRDAPTILLLQSWQTTHSRLWKMQIPYLSRHYRVVVYDPVGNGRSDRIQDASRYEANEVMADAVAVLDHTGTETALIVGTSYGGGIAIGLGAFHGERIDGIIPIAASHAWGVAVDRSADERWEMYDPEFWRSDWEGFVRFFFDECCSDAHSTKLFEDTVRWALETTGETIATVSEAGPSYELDEFEAAVRSIESPVLLIHGTGDRIIVPESSDVLQSMIPHAELLLIDGAGHIPIGRYAARINHAIKDFADRVYGVQRPDSQWHVGTARSSKALFLSSPIGLGHVRRDIAIADELRERRPDLEIEWLTQEPATSVLESEGETVHPASATFANESAHFESMSGEHDLHAFQTLREMDEIQMANFLLTDEVIEAGQYDLVVGDEAWELDFQLHENPGLKKSSFAWITDFVGFLPMGSGGEREAFVTADYNAQMIEQVARYKRVRDKAVFVGNPNDIIDTSFGPDLPMIRDWTETNYDFTGYITGFDPTALGDREQLRAELGYYADERVCIASVGGTGVGGDLLRRIVESYPAAKRHVDDLRMIVVTGPRINPSTLPQVDGVEYREFVPKLYRHLAAADLAIVQGGLTTTMELTALKVPFIYVPLRNHFEQMYHVKARLDRYGAGTYMEYDDIDPDSLSTAIASEMETQVNYVDVETDGAARAAELIAALV